MDKEFKYSSKLQINVLSNLYNLLYLYGFDLLVLIIHRHRPSWGSEMWRADFPYHSKLCRSIGSICHLGSAPLLRYQRHRQHEVRHAAGIISSRNLQSHQHSYWWKPQHCHLQLLIHCSEINQAALLISNQLHAVVNCPMAFDCYSVF